MGRRALPAARRRRGSLPRGRHRRHRRRQRAAQQGARGDQPLAGAASPFWDTYVHRWTRWNHVRTVSSLAAAGTLVLAAASSR
jgi:hypothetical protein